MVLSATVGRSVAVSAADDEIRMITGLVQNQDLRRVDQAIVQVRDQEGNVVAQGVTNQAGEFTVRFRKRARIPSVRFRIPTQSEFVVVKIGIEQAAPVTLTLAVTKEIALEIVSPLPAIQYKSSSETYQLSRKEIEALPKGNNNDVYEVLLTVPSVAYGGAQADTYPAGSCAISSFGSTAFPFPIRSAGRSPISFRREPGSGPTSSSAGWKRSTEIRRRCLSISRARAVRNRDSAPCKSSADPMKP